MDNATHMRVAMARTDHLYNVFRTVLFAYTALAGIIVFGDAGAHGLMLSVVIIGIAIFGVLSCDDTLKELKALFTGMDPEGTGASAAYLKVAKTAPFGAFRAATAIVLIAIALGLLYGVWAD